MKHLLLVSTYLFLSIQVCAQNHGLIDSLLSRTETPLSGTELVDIYNKVALEYSGIDSVNSSLYIKNAIRLSDSLNYQRGKADAYYVISRNSMLRGDYSKSETQIKKLLEISNNANYERGKANALFGLGWLNYYHGKYKESISFHSDALQIRQKLQITEDISSSLRGIGISYKLLGEFDKALSNLYESLAIEQSINHKNGIAECLNHIGIINSLRGDYPSALDSYFQALDIQQEVDDKSGLAYTYQNIGIIHYQQKDYTKTLEYYEQSLNIRKEIGETRGVAQINYNMGVVYHELAQFEKAQTYYFNALRIKEQLDDKRGMADNFLSIGKLYSDQKDYNDAINYQQLALKIAEETNSDWGKVNALIGLGESYEALGDYLKSKKVLKEAIEISQKSKLVESIREAVRILAKVENDLGHYQEAYEAQLYFQQISDSLSNEATTKRITLLEAEHDFKVIKDSIQFANEKEKLILDQRISQQRNTQWIFFGAMIVLIIIILILYRYTQLKNKTNRRLTYLNDEIQRNNESLRQLNEETKNLIGIVAHDLKSPLTAVIGAVGLLDKESLTEDDYELKEIIEGSSKRMSKMISEILNVESIEKSLQDIKIEPHNLSPIVEEVCKQFSDQAEKKDISINTSIEPNLTGLVDGRYIFQVFENLISNALKFSPSGKQVHISLFQSVNRIQFFVKDQGPGISDQDREKMFQKFQRLSAKPTGDEHSTGLGLSIVKQFVEKMNGNVWVESEVGMGSKFVVELESN